MIAIFLLAIGFLAFFGLINFMMHEQVGDHNDLVSDDVKEVQAQLHLTKVLRKITSMIL